MEITYHHYVASYDIPALDKSIKGRINRAIEQKLRTGALIYGAPLRHSLKKLWRLRVGDWRIVYTIDNRGVFILGIGHRKEIYKLIVNRI